MNTANSRGEIVSGSLVRIGNEPQIYEVGAVRYKTIDLYINNKKVAEIEKTKATAV